MKRKTAIWIIITIVFLLAIWFFFLKKKEQPLVLETQKPERGYIAEIVTATGTIQPVDTTMVGTRVSGTIEEIYADFNSTVKKGQLLAVLDKSLLQATVDQFKASLAEAKSNVNFQESNFNRQKQLFATGSISRADYETALNNYNAANASVENIQAQLRSAERNLSFTNIYSPVDGVVLNRSVSVGQTVAASFSTPTLFVIARDITRMQVQVAVDEADIGNVAQGQRATFTVDAYLDDTFEGTVEEIRLRPNRSSNVVTYTTLINAPNENKKLKPGMTANISIYTREVHNALLISTEALKFRPDSSIANEYTIKPIAKNNRTNKIEPDNTSIQPPYVWILQGKSLLQKKVQTGLNNNTQVQILNGLTGDERVVTRVQNSGQETQTGTPSSPFMPRRPGGGGRR